MALWASTVQEMMAAEGVRDYDANVHQNAIQKGFTRHYIVDGNAAETPCCIYHEDSPVMMCILLPKDTAVVKVYDGKAEEYTALYGTPNDYAAADIHTLLRIIWPARPALENYQRVTAWRLSDGTLAALLTVNGENIMAYINEERLLTHAD